MTYIVVERYRGGEKVAEWTFHSRIDAEAVWQVWRRDYPEDHVLLTTQRWK